MQNFGLRQAKQQIVNFIKGLPYDHEVKRLLVKDIYDEFKDEADRAVIEEVAEIEKAQKEKEKDHGKKVE